MCPIPEKDDRYWGRQLGGETTYCTNSTAREGLPRRIPTGFSLPLFFSEESKTGDKDIKQLPKTHAEMPVIRKRKRNQNCCED